MITSNADKTSIEIKDLDGNKYRFKKYTNFLNYTSNLQSIPPFSDFFVLKEIVLSNNETLEFSYDESIKAEGFMKHHQIAYHFDPRYSDLKGGARDSNLMGTLECKRTDWNKDVSTKIHGSNLSMRIKQIKYGDLVIDFKGTNELGESIDNYSFRKDAKGQLEAIKKIEIKFKNQIIDSFDFNYSYFISTDTQDEKPEKYRLKLESITQNGLLKHNFEYYEDTKLPSRDSFAQDSWGFYNGKNSNQSLLSSVSFTSSNQSFHIPGADRTIGSLAQTRAFMLKRIIYPTGGYTDFSYKQLTEEKLVVKNKAISKGIRLDLDIWSQENLTRKKEIINLREFGYNAETDSLFFRSTNDCDNNTNSVNNELSPSKSNGSIGFSIEGGYHFGGINHSSLLNSGFTTTKNLNYGPMYPVGNEVSLHIFRMGMGECTVIGSIYYIRTVKDTVKTTKVIGPIYLAGYNSYDSNNKLEKEVFYRYQKKFDEKSETVEASYKSPILVGISEKDRQEVQITPNSNPNSVLKNRKCVALVRSSFPMNNVQEVYFPSIHEVTVNKGRKSYEYTGGGFSSIETEITEPYYNFDLGAHLETDMNWMKGYLLKEIFYTDTGTKIKSIENKYKYDNSYVLKSKDYSFDRGISYNVVTEGKFLTMHKSVRMFPNYYYKYALIAVESSWIKKTEEIITNYTNESALSTLVEYEYDNLTLPSTKKIKINTDIFEERYTYPLEGSPMHLIKKGALLKREIIKNGEKLSSVENIYKNWGNNLIDLEEIKITKGNQNIESTEKILYRDSTNGNIIELTRKGVKEVYLYGYGKTSQIAKIVNASKEEVARALGVSVNNLTHIDENKILQINELRNNPNFKEAFITTYEHKPLIGILKITDSKGQSQNFEYNSSNQLNTIKDNLGNMLETYEYNYKNN